MGVDFTSGSEGEERGEGGREKKEGGERGGEAGKRREERRVKWDDRTQGVEFNLREWKRKGKSVGEASTRKAEQDENCRERRRTRREEQVPKGVQES
ncbi:hypothetical protein ACROYT_G020702 [Oculina patagonica]